MVSLRLRYLVISFFNRQQHGQNKYKMMILWKDTLFCATILWYVELWACNDIVVIKSCFTKNKTWVRISELFPVGPKSNFTSNTDWWFILYVIMFCFYRLEKTNSFDGNHGNRSGHCRRRTDSFDGPVGKMYKTFDNSCVCQDDSSLFHLVCGWVFWKSMKIIWFLKKKL